MFQVFREIRSPLLIGSLGFVIAALVGLLIVRYGAADEPQIGLKATAVLTSLTGASIGTVEFTQASTGVLVAAEAKGLEPGGHAFIVHDVGSCAPDFSAAGDHFNPEGTGHGFAHPNWSMRDSSSGGHGGDLPNIYAASDGSARADFFTDGITLQDGERHSVFDADGSAVVVHEKPDSYGEHESDTGERVACGVIQRS